MSKSDSISIERYPDRAAWLEARRRSIGGSDSAAILGLSPWASPITVYASKLALLPDDDPETREAARWGILLEPLVAQRYREETGLSVEDPGPYAIVRNVDYPFLHTSPDRFVTHPDWGRGLVSIKTTSAYKASDWAEGVPLPFQVQCQHEMCVTGLSWSAVAVLIGGQTFRYVARLDANPDFQAQLVQTLGIFWAHVVEQTPPVADHSAASTALLRALWPKDSGETIALPAELTEVDARWLEAKRQVDYWDREKTRAENELRQALGPATRGLLPDGDAWSNRLQTRAEHVVPETQFRVLRRHKGKGNH
jgi:putative phage-type endonuclease